MTEEHNQTDGTPESGETPRPDFMGDEVVVGESSPEPGATRPAGRVWIPISIIGAFIVGIALGVLGTLVFSGDDATDGTAQAAEGPDGGAGGVVSEITIPPATGDDSGAFGTVEVSGSPLPRLAEAELALGLPAPEVTGHDFEGNTVSITNDGRAKIIVFMAHWCPYCQQELPIVRDWYGGEPIPDNVDVYSVSTLTNPSRSNYPPGTWFAQEGWNVPLIVDDRDDSVAGAFGLNAVPFWVLIDADGTIVGRHAGGGIPAESLTGAATELSAPTDPAGG